MSKKICERKIFISSTIHNLKEERTAVQKRLQQPFNHVRFEAIFSDRPETLNMSGDDLETRVGYNPNLFSKCLKRWRSVIIAPTCYTCVHSITKGVVA